MTGPLDNSIPLSQALPEEEDRFDLKEGMQFAITGIILVDHESNGKAWQTAKINGLSLPDGNEFVKYKSGSIAVVRACADLLVRACFADGSCKKPVRVRVEGKDGQKGRYLLLVDA
jgi:hypothetical protein